MDGWMFNDLKEATTISREVHCTFQHAFINYGSTVFHDKHVYYPKNKAEALTHMVEYEMAALPGCIGSSDATHILLEKCSH